MKIQCGVCNKEPASVFCTADEATLCDACDHRVHHANKLASKHQRFPLLHPSSPDQVPPCDICQEKRAFLLCVQDRAILCEDCDAPIHSANEHTQKHDRFLLTGVKVELSAASALNNSSSIVPLSKDGDFVPELSVDDPFSAAKSSSVTATEKNSGDHYNYLLASSMSSISEYLVEMLPGWHVEDFLDSGFSESVDGMLPFFDADLESNTSPFSPGSLEIWVPQQSPSSLYTPQNSSPMGGQIEFKERKEIIGMKAERWTDDAFTVPEIIPPSIGSKRLRPLS
ncbi:B BOX 21, B-box domain protein 21, long hypocotyl under shade, salt tolerance homolog2 [Hibiscus trionum]|uniref:B BOX 21, B-box domain protein 21, long hypocotyl under shade, salt tolerance homolog2 n=1 Tax=Hibiscus trionum TaxID=183268 RepID=A0A9W7I6J2_HIBTR|nr:B BOX 21, B-box domain protein 21, long hypocotyl under shade, salt tolerance homolog2 [Hibiscus trionum]